MTTIQPILQFGALGLLALFGFGLFVLAKMVAPSIKEFLLGLVADLKANTAALGQLRETMIIEVRGVLARVDQVEERVKAHVTATARGVENEVRDQASKTGEHVARTGEHVALTVGVAVDALAARGSSADISGDLPRRPSPPTPVRGFVPLRQMPSPSTRGVPPRRTVLIVEDDIAQARVIKQCLVAEISGIFVNLVHSATEALAALGISAVMPNVAVIDCNLGDGYGWDVANRAPRSVQIILMSGHVDAAMLSKLADGVRAVWIRKPFEIDELVGLVRERLEVEA